MRKTLALISVLALAASALLVPTSATAARTPTVASITGYSGGTASSCTTSTCVKEKIVSYIKWADGRYIDTDNVPSYNVFQCVDPVKDLTDKLYGPMINGLGDAKNWYLKYSSTPALKALFIKKPASASPKVGWIAVYGYGESGHIALVAQDGVSHTKRKVWDWYYTSTIRLLHQNAPTAGYGTRGDPTHITWYPTKNLLGYLVPRGLIQLPEETTTATTAVTPSGKTALKVALKTKIGKKSTRVTGTVSARSTVRLQFRKGSKWVTVKSKKGVKSFSLKTTKRGTLRVLIPATSTHKTFTKTVKKG